MDQASVPKTQKAIEDDCPTCGYTPKPRDRWYIIDQKVWLVRCYRCGGEWVE